MANEYRQKYNELAARIIRAHANAKAGEQQAEKMCIDAIEVGASYVRNFKS